MTLFYDVDTHLQTLHEKEGQLQPFHTHLCILFLLRIFPEENVEW